MHLPVSGFTLIRNGVSFDYPFLESLRSLVPLVDELVINVGVGPNTDSTLEVIQNFARKIETQSSGKKTVKILKSEWPLNDPEKKRGGKILSEQTNLALNACTHDWCIYLQSDEVIHQDDIPTLQNAVARAALDPRIEGLLFNYLHFYGSYGVVQQTRSAYRREVRVVRRSSGAQSIGDAQSFRTRDGRKLNVLHIPARIFHYGWVRTPEAMREKTAFMDQLYHGTVGLHTGDNYRYKRFWGLTEFKATHPAVMNERIAQKGWNWDLKSSPFNWHWKDLKKVASDLIEKWTDYRPFEYRSYKIIESRPPLRAAVLISTYNSPELLSLCIQSFSNQTSDNFDLFIADDGSTDATRDVINQLRPLFKGQSIHHVWHPDQGYQKSKIHNQALKTSAHTPVTVCIDGDVIVHRRFIEDHLALHSNTLSPLLVMGRRIDLDADTTQSLKAGQLLATRFNHGFTLPLFKAFLSRRVRNIWRSVRISNPWLQKLLGRRRVVDLLGSNFSVTTSLLHHVNGFNEDFKSYWGEDGDLFIRLRNAGARLYGIKGYAIQYHLNHPRLEPKPEHVAHYQSRLNDPDYLTCERGILRLK